MKFLRYLCAIAASIALIAGILVAVVEICCFSDISFYRTQYDTLNVNEDVGMTLDDLMDVTTVMLDYLQGKRDDLVVETTMWGQKREFFNDREKGHMVDVQALNLNACKLMWICFAAGIILMGISLFATPKDNHLPQFLKTFAGAFCLGTIIFLSAVGIGALIVSKDFDYYWRSFHPLFFNNDLWLLDPATDMLINIVPLEFFIALVSKCAISFGCVIVLLLLICILYLIKARGRRSLAVIICFALIAGTPKCAYADMEEPEISAESAVVIEKNTGVVLYSKNANRSEFPASTTKIMTALLALENLNLDDEILFSKKAINSLPTGASHIGMKAGEILTVRECMYGLLLPSANEVANALAEAVSGNSSDFVALMNSRAMELGCENTNFANPSGLHDNLHYTCAIDLARIFSACIDTPNFLDIDSTVTHVIPATNLVAETRPMRTTHEMLRADSAYYDTRVICGKTGHTDQAEACLVTYARANNLELIIVVMKAQAPNQYTDTAALMDYCFSNFVYGSSSQVASYLFDYTTDNALLQFSSIPSPELYEISNASFIVPKDLTKCDISLRVDDDKQPVAVELSLNNQLLASLQLNRTYTKIPDILTSADAVPIVITQHNYTPYIIAAIVVGAGILAVFLLLFFSESARRTRRYHRQARKNKSL